jgi:dUTP pyrophosphatase
MNTKIKIPTLSENKKNTPQYGSEGASGADVRANITENIILAAGSSRLIPTGLRFAVPVGYEIQVRPRSGLALKHQITVLNTPGTIDSDYRGEVGVIVINHGKEDFIVEPGMRIAQIILSPVHQADFVFCDNLNDTDRGDGGFGHTGLN